jgi:hypothetical protein
MIYLLTFLLKDMSRYKCLFLMYSLNSNLIVVLNFTFFLCIT